jgi:hypothetical protein
LLTPVKVSSGTTCDAIDEASEGLDSANYGRLQFDELVPTSRSHGYIDGIFANLGMLAQ